MKVYILSHNNVPVALVSDAQKALEFAGIWENLDRVDIHEAELDRPPERLILAGHLVYSKNLLNGDELWPSEEFSILINQAHTGS